MVVCESAEPPAVVRELLASRGLDVVRARSFHEARDPACLAEIDAVLICESPGGWSNRNLDGDLQLLADALVSHRLMGVVLSPGASGVAPGDENAFMLASPDASADELWGRLSTVRQYRPFLNGLEDQVATMQRLGKKLNQDLVEVDRELRLASRLQRDFLPSRLPEVGDVRFAALYRPATWVSGDIYDVRRLDEAHVGFFLADAVGHGVASGLLSMFIMKAVVGKRIEKGGYTIVPPGEVLARLNKELAEQELPHSQFVTACYATIDTATCELTFARGGHPHPIYVSPDGRCSEVKTVGGLLGVFPNEDFPNVTLVLEPGAKLIIYSDGVEDAIICRRQREQGRVSFTPEFLDSVRSPAQTCLDALATRLDRFEGSLQPADDQTCLIVERLPQTD